MGEARHTVARASVYHDGGQRGGIAQAACLGDAAMADDALVGAEEPEAEGAGGHGDDDIGPDIIERVQSLPINHVEQNEGTRRGDDSQQNVENEDDPAIDVLNLR